MLKKIGLGVLTIVLIFLLYVYLNIFKQEWYYFNYQTLESVFSGEKSCRIIKDDISIVSYFEYGIVSKSMLKTYVGYSGTKYRTNYGVNHAYHLLGEYSISDASVKKYNKCINSKIVKNYLKTL